jgi:ATP-binding cassette, subfamily B, multidrug efflux pump
MSQFQEELETQQYSLKDVSLLKTFGHYLKPHRWVFIEILVLDAFVNACFMIEPIITRYLINYLQAPSEGMKWVFIYVGIDAGTMLLGSIGGYFVDMGLRKLGQAIVYDFRNDIFSHVLSLSQAQLRTLSIGSYVTRITNDTQNISSFFSDILPQALRAVLSLIIIIGSTFFYEGLYGFIFLAYLPVVFVLAFLFRRKAKGYYRTEKKSISQMNSFLSESFQGVEITKSYNREDKKNIEFTERNDAIASAYLHSQNLFAIFYPFMYLLQMSCVLLVIGIGAPAVVSGVLLVGDLSLLYSYSTQFFGPIQTLTSLLNSLQSILSSAERTQTILSLSPEITTQNDSIDVPSFRGAIEFRHVTFSYVKGDPVLKDVSFRIQPGKTVAFVGATGAGKSTIISLLARIYEVDSGEILIDDVDIRKYSLNCLRRNIGMMLQDVFLFSGTIAENISLDDPSVSEEEVEKACVDVGADSFISRLPKKYNEKVTERGDNFSSGQKQLISFARTLVYHPSLVLLDEATANIDTETEAIIQASLEKFRTIGTMVIVAHRLSTIKGADDIFVVSHGRIVEEGDHQALLRKRGIYYNLYRLQNMTSEENQAEEVPQHA